MKKGGGRKGGEEEKRRKGERKRDRERYARDKEGGKKGKKQKLSLE